MVVFIGGPTHRLGLFVPSLHRPAPSRGLDCRNVMLRGGGVGVPAGLCVKPGPAQAMSMALDPGLLAASALIGGVLWLAIEGYESCPIGHIPIDLRGKLQVKKSNVEGAGLGLFAAVNFEKGDILGSYPGRKWPQQLWLNRKAGGDKKAQDRARTYVWLMDDGSVIDPTNAQGELEEMVPWLLPGNLRLPLTKVSTILSRINEPPKGCDTNVCADYVGGEVVFSLERSVEAGEELYLDYGPMYERKDYGGAGSGSLGTMVFPSD